MQTKTFNLIFVCALILALGLALRGEASAAARAAQGVALSKTYVGQDFYPNTSRLTYETIGTGRYMTFYAGAGTGLFTRLDLPQGAQITKVDFYFRDSGGEFMDFYLMRYAPDEAPLILAYTNSSGLQAIEDLRVRSVTLAAPATVDNSRYAYQLFVLPAEPNASHRIEGARVEYIVPAGYLPLVER